MIAMPDTEQDDARVQQAAAPPAPPERHGYGIDSDCLCGRNFAKVRGLREHLTKARAAARDVPSETGAQVRPERASTTAGGTDG